ncbi:MAG: hypothetical protein U0790_09585 [Isosphaeraceae bacterium]
MRLPTGGFTMRSLRQARFAGSRREPAHLVLALALTLAALGRSAEVCGQSPLAAPAAPLARYVPRQDLAAYWELEGLGAHPAAWRGTAAYRSLNETSLGLLLEDVAAQMIDLAQQSTPPARRVPPADYLALLKQLAEDGLAAGVFKEGPRDYRPVLAFRKGNRPGSLRLLESIESPVEGAGHKPESLRKGNRTLHPIGRDAAWWAEGDDLIITTRDAVDLVIDVIEGRKPSAAGHPRREALRQPAKGFTPVAYGFVDLSALPAMPPDAVKLGFDGLKRVEIQWGFQSEALMTSVRLQAPSPRRGVLGLLDQPTFKLNALPPIPAGQTSFAVLSIDAAPAYDRFVALRKSASPAGNDVDAFENGFRQAFGLDPRGDLLAHLGPRLAVYSQAPAHAPAGNPLEAMVLPYTGLTLVAEVKDEVALARSLETLIEGINRMLTQRQGGQGVDPPQFRKKAGSRSAYVFEFPPGSVPDGVIGMLSPTITLEKGHLVLSGSSAAEEGAWRSSMVRPTAALVANGRARADGLAASSRPDRAGRRRSARPSCPDREPAGDRQAAQRPDGGPGPAAEAARAPNSTPPHRSEKLPRGRPVAGIPLPPRRRSPPTPTGSGSSSERRCRA